MENKKQVEEIRNQLIELGRERAVRYTATQFPDWCLFKIGLHNVQGLPYDHNYYEELMATNLSDEQNH